MLFSFLPRLQRWNCFAISVMAAFVVGLLVAMPGVAAAVVNIEECADHELGEFSDMVPTPPRLGEITTSQYYGLTFIRSDKMIIVELEIGGTNPTIVFEGDIQSRGAGVFAWRKYIRTRGHFPVVARADDSNPPGGSMVRENDMKPQELRRQDKKCIPVVRSM